MESTTHYNGTVTLGFDPIKHIYTLDGEKVQGVTTALQIIAKPALIYWAAKMGAEYVEQNLVPGKSYDEVEISELAKNVANAHRQKKDTAADTGTMIHQWIQDFIEGKNPSMPVNEGMQRAVKSFLDWWIKEDIKVIQTEARLCSPTLKLAGTADLVCLHNGKLTIMDWKTGSGIYPEMFLQMGAYALMYEEEFGTKVERMGIINCSVKANFGRVFTDKVLTAKRTYKDILKLNASMKNVEEILKG